MIVEKYNNNFDFTNLTDFEKAFLQSIVNEAVRSFSDLAEYYGELSKDMIKHIENIKSDFNIKCLDEDAIEYCLAVAKEAEKVLDIPIENIQTFAGDLLFDLLFDFEFIEQDTQQKKDFFNEYFGFITPFISISTNKDIRVFCE